MFVNKTIETKTCSYIYQKYRSYLLLECYMHTSLSLLRPYILNIKILRRVSLFLSKMLLQYIDLVVVELIEKKRLQVIIYKF